MIDTAALEQLRHTVRDIRGYYKANKAWQEGSFTLSLPIVRYLCRDLSQSAFENLLAHLQQEGEVHFQHFIADPTVSFTDTFLEEKTGAEAVQ